MKTEQMEIIPKEKRDAVFSHNRIYRYELTIVWDEVKPLCQFIGLNPSTADEVRDDPTIRRIKGFCRNWGYGGVVMTNLFAFRATNPDAMKAYPEPTGDRNDWHIHAAHSKSALTVAAWGNHGSHFNRAAHVSRLIAGMKCFRLTKENQPEHPLYMPADIKLIDFNSRHGLAL